MNPVIEHNFRYHPPVGASVLLHTAVRSKIKEVAQFIDANLPALAGREKATAITKLEEAMMWACAGIARHATESPHPSPEPRVEPDDGNTFITGPDIVIPK